MPVAAAGRGARLTVHRRGRSRTYLDHLTVERGLSAQHARRRTAATCDRYAGDAGRGRASTDLAEVTRGRRRRAPRRAARGRRRAPAAVGGVRGPRGQRGPRPAPVRRCARAWRPTTPAATCSRRRRPSGCPRRSTSTEVERLLAVAGGDEPLGLRDRALLEFLYGTGARISEAVGARRRRPRPRRAGTVAAARQGRRGPGSCRSGGYARGRARRLPGAGPARAGRRPGAGAPAVFLNARGGPLSRQSAWTILRRAAGRAGCRSTARARCPRTRCGTRSRPTCSTAAPTCGWCRSCSGTPR